MLLSLGGPASPSSDHLHPFIFILIILINMLQLEQFIVVFTTLKLLFIAATELKRLPNLNEIVVFSLSQETQTHWNYDGHESYIFVLGHSFSQELCSALFTSTRHSIKHGSVALIFKPIRLHNTFVTCFYLQRIMYNLTKNNLVMI